MRRLQPTPFAVLNIFHLARLIYCYCLHCSLLLLLLSLVVVVVMFYVLWDFFFLIVSLAAFDCRRGLNLSFTWSALIRIPTETARQTETGCTGSAAEEELEMETEPRRVVQFS